MLHACSIVYVLLTATLTGATETEIFGGRVTKPHSRPYMVSLQIDGSHSCGGILIREDYVLTAAHCKGPSDRTMMVVVGAHNISKKEKSQQRIHVAKYYQHPKYNDIYYDIMLLKLEKNATLNKYVKTIGLPKKDGKIPANINCVVAGWGKTGVNQPVSDVLKEATEKMQFSTECKNKWGIHFNSQYMICTNFDKKKGGICQGDSGGPLICNTKPQGITIFTEENGCDKPTSPHVFTKISFFVSWIKKVMKE